MPTMHEYTPETDALTEAIVGTEIDRRNFRRKIKELNVLTDTGAIRQQGRHRPAALYRFRPQRLADLRSRQRKLPF